MSEINLTLSGIPGEGPSGINAQESTPAVATGGQLPSADNLSADKIAAAEKLAGEIDLSQSLVVMDFGGHAQRKLSSAIDRSAQVITNCDISEIGKLLAEMYKVIQEFDDAMQWPRRDRSLRIRYEQTSKALGRLSKQLEGWWMTLAVQVGLYDGLARGILDSYEELSVLILAGKIALEKSQSTPVSPAESLVPYDRQNLRNSFEQHLYDLTVTQTIAAQTLMQIQLAEETYRQLARQIHRGITQAVPLWQQNVATALTLHNGKKLIELDNAQLLKSIKSAIATQSTEIRKPLRPDISTDPQTMFAP